MATTPDGDIIASFMSVSHSSSMSGYQRGLSETVLRYGQVTQVYYPDNDGNVNKRFTEYDVTIQHVGPDGSQTQIPYPRCLMASLFGGVADNLEWTPRVLKPDGSDAQGRAGLNSVVAVLCLNSDINRGLIIGALKHPSLPVETNEGHHLDFAFNGVTAAIDKNGGLALTRNGATKADGKPLKTDANAGASLTFGSDGTTVLASGKMNQFIAIGGPDTENKNESDDQVVDNQVMTIAADQLLNITSGKDIFVTVPNGDRTGETGSVQICVQNQDPQAAMLGNNYRNAQNKLNTEMSNQLKAIANLILVASQGIASAASAPGAQALTGAASALVEAGQALSEIATAIDEFEAPPVPYVSGLVFLG